MDQNTAARSGIEGAGAMAHLRALNWNRLPRHEEALARLEYVAARRHGFALVTGPAGSGKSMLLREFAGDVRRRGAICMLVDASGCGETELLKECCDELGLGCPTDWSAGQLHSALLEAVRGRCTVGTPVVLLVDHADRGRKGAARLIERLLHATYDLPGLTIVATSRNPAPAALSALARSCADVRIELSPLTADETGDLIEALCGPGEQYPRFTPEAIDALYAVTDGELRDVNRLWRLLQTAAAVEEMDGIDATMVAAMARELPQITDVG